MAVGHLPDHHDQSPLSAVKSALVTNNNAQFSTNFTVSIEAAEGVTTGISARPRGNGKAAVAKEAKASDLVQPGHIFPLMAQDGVLTAQATLKLVVI